MQSIQLIPDSILAAMLRGLIVGLVLGLIPLTLGFLRKKRRLGVYGLFSSTIGGAILTGIFSLIIVPVFAWLILRKPKTPITEVSEQSADTDKLE